FPIGIYDLRTNEQVNHIKYFTRQDTFFDILQMDRDICLRSSRTCWGLGLLAPEAASVTFAQKKTEWDVDIFYQFDLQDGHAKEIGVKLNVPAPYEDRIH